jgi:hypothetical protein
MHGMGEHPFSSNQQNDENGEELFAHTSEMHMDVVLA